MPLPVELEPLPPLTGPKIYTASEVENIKREIEALDLRLAEDIEIAKIIQKLVYGYGLSIPSLKPPVRLFRGRACAKPTNISELLYPPVDRTPLGRANRAGSPVFYCSSDFHTPSFEASITVGDMYAMSSWETTRKLTVNAVGYTRSAFQKLDSERASCGWDFEHIDEKRAELLAELFTEKVAADQRHRFRLTSALADNMSQDIFDGIMYPTMARYANGDNFALKREYADSLKFIEVRFWRLRKIDTDARGRVNGRKFFTEVDSAREIATDGTINWLGPGALGLGEYVTTTL